jgi:hypothetical protein
MPQIRDTNAKRFSTFIAGVVFIPFCVSIMLNFIVDPFGVFQTPWFPKQLEANQRYLKIELIGSRPEEFNGLLWGSSRIGNTSPRTIERYIPGVRFYNMYYGNGTISDHLANLGFLISQYPHIRHHYIQIDIDLFLGTSEWGAGAISSWRHPAADGDSRALFFARNLLTMPLRTIAKKVEVNLYGGTPSVRQELSTTGMWLDDRSDERIAADHAGYISDQQGFSDYRVKRTLRGSKVSTNVAALKKVADLCDKSNLNCIFFTTPHHHKMLDLFVTNDYLEALREIASVTNFWDFSSYNTVTCDDSLYYEISHYRQPVGRLIAARIFGDQAVYVPSNFGVFVTRSNVEAIVDERRINFAKSRC